MSRLLVVDDDIQMLSALGEALRRKGHIVETASNGIDAASKLENAAVQAVITDLRMPGMNGLELQRCLSQNGNHIPIIFLSAHASEADERSALRAGAVQFLRKPISKEALLSAIREALREPS